MAGWKRRTSLVATRTCGVIYTARTRGSVNALMSVRAREQRVDESVRVRAVSEAATALCCQTEHACPRPRSHAQSTLLAQLSMGPPSLAKVGIRGASTLMSCPRITLGFPSYGKTVRWSLVTLCALRGRLTAPNVWYWCATLSLSLASGASCVYRCTWMNGLHADVLTVRGLGHGCLRSLPPPQSGTLRCRCVGPPCLCVPLPFMSPPISVTMRYSPRCRRAFNCTRIGPRRSWRTQPGPTRRRPIISRPWYGC